VFTESYMDMDQSAFHYDYETLRTTGVILAVVMFVSGILIALSNKGHHLYNFNGDFLKILQVPDFQVVVVFWPNIVIS
uniref:FXYD domain-containing ion transport regulator n=1 Tax=Cyprinus carpio TaxID=7962 RepID=A0A8C2H1J7_CYPCA